MKFCTLMTPFPRSTTSSMSPFMENIVANKVCKDALSHTFLRGGHGNNMRQYNSQQQQSERNNVATDFNLPCKEEALLSETSFHTKGESCY